MEILLAVAVILTALAIITQAGVLVAMYLMSRRLADKAEPLMNAGQRLMPHFETITGNLKTASDHLAESGKIARDQTVHMQQFATETQQDIRAQLAQVRATVFNTVDEARATVMRPVREYSAIASGIAEGIRTFFSRRKPTIVKEETIITTDDRPAA